MGRGRRATIEPTRDPSLPSPLPRTRGPRMSLDADSPAVAADGKTHVASSRATQLPIQQIGDAFDRCSGRLLQSLIARGATRSEAQEIVRRTFEQALSMKMAGSASVLDRYLFGATRDLAATLFKNRGTRQLNDVLPNSESIPERPMERERYEVLQRVIQELPAKCQMTLRLRIWNELSYPEIVARFSTLGIEINERTLRLYVRQGLERCRREIVASEGRRQRERG
jgi:DNA-directed RNA polymerase specialized sigma24 family protein